MSKWLIAFLLIELSMDGGFEEKFKEFREKAEQELKCKEGIRIMAYSGGTDKTIVVAECR